MSGGLTYTIEQDRITLNGNLVLFNINQELTELFKQITQPDRTLIICCANIAKIDSAGLGWLLSSVKTCRLLKKKCHIVNFPANIHKLITLYLTKAQQKFFYDAQP